MLESYKKQNESLVNKKAFRSRMVWAQVLNATLGMFLFGYVLSVLNTIQDYLSLYVYDWGLDSGRTRVSVLNSILTVGAELGAFLGGSFAQKYGRRKSMMMTDLAAILGLGLTLFANYPLFVIGRMVSGFCVGINSSIVPVYVGEVAPTPIKGTTGSANQLLVCFGSLIAYLFGFGLPNNSAGEGFIQENWWRIMLGFPIVTSILRALILFTIFKSETPRYLAFNGQEEEARKALSEIYIGDFVTEQLIWLKR